MLKSGLKFPESPYTDGQVSTGRANSLRVGRRILTNNIVVVSGSEVRRDGDLDGALPEREVAGKHAWGRGEHESINIAGIAPREVWAH